MGEEEKKAISIVENIKFKKYKIYIAKEMKDEIRFYQTEEERKAIDIVLNLIEKLQKEIKYIRDKNQDLVEENSTKDGDYEELKDNFNEYKANSIPKNKIKKKIEELNNYYKKEVYPIKYQWADVDITEFYDSQIDLLEDLLKGE